MAQSEMSPMYRCPDGNVVRFYDVAVPHDALSLQRGAPVFWKALMAEIRSPGVKNQIHHQEIELRDESGKVVRRKLAGVSRDKTRMYYDDVFRDQLKAWKENRQGVDALGTPLENYPKIDIAQAAMLRASGLHTLEQLRDVPDAQLPQLGPQARTLRDGAKTFLDAMNQTGDIRAEVERLRAQIAELQTAKPAKRGRKPKAAADHAAAA